MTFTSEAVDNVQSSYNEIKGIADDILEPYFCEVDKLVKSLGNNINNLSVETIRNTIVELSIHSYKLGEVKDKSAIKADIAEALRKEKYAIECTKSEGTKLDKDNKALLESSPQVVSEMLYNLIANLTKTKVDEIHRLVDSLKSILMSRMQELKMSMDSSVMGD